MHHDKGPGLSGISRKYDPITRAVRSGFNVIHGFMQFYDDPGAK